MGFLRKSIWLILIAIFGTTYKHWDFILIEFCKVDTVYWQAEPNWLGWLLITYAALLLLKTTLDITEWSLK